MSLPLALISQQSVTQFSPLGGFQIKTIWANFVNKQRAAAWLEVRRFEQISRYLETTTLHTHNDITQQTALHNLTVISILQK